MKLKFKKEIFSIMMLSLALAEYDNIIVETRTHNESVLIL